MLHRQTFKLFLYLICKVAFSAVCCTGSSTVKTAGHNIYIILFPVELLFAGALIILYQSWNRF